MKSRKRNFLIISYVVVITVIILHMSPLAIVVLNSLRTSDEVLRSMIGIPAEAQWGNFAFAWETGNYTSAYISTIIIAISTGLIVMMLTGLASYGITKCRCYFREFFSTYFVVALSIPFFAMMVPIFFLFHRLGLTNSRIGMIIIYSATNMPFCFIFTLAFFKGLPEELDEAARIDGCTEVQNFIYNCLPLAKPILTSILLIVFVNCWNEFLFANLFLQTDNVRTVALSFFIFTGQYRADFGPMFAAAIITIVPIIVFYLLMQRTFIDGLIAGSIKG